LGHVPLQADVLIPVELAHLPAPQFVHSRAPASAYFPVGQLLVQVDEASCVVDPYRPASQLWHMPAPDKEYFPAGQVPVHEVCPLKLAYLPPGQALQKFCPFAGAYLPVGHFVQVLDFLYLPAEQ